MFLLVLMMCHGYYSHLVLSYLHYPAVALLCYSNILLRKFVDYITNMCLQCFDAVGSAEGHPACKKQWSGAGMVICLERSADLHTAQLMPLPLMSLASVKSRLVLPFCYRLTRVVLDKGLLNGVCVYVTNSVYC